MSIPKHDELYTPLIEALKILGGSASIQELEGKVSEILHLSDKDLSIMDTKHNRSLFGYRLAWARSYLKRAGIIENTERGVWALTKAGSVLKSVEKEEINRKARAESVRLTQKKKSHEIDTESDESFNWQQKLLSIMKEMSPDAFERLCKRFLRESGFLQVEVTGKSGDGGIDGHGVVKIGGLLSFHVYFQAKRYKETVTPSVVRDFRGAMVGRADKGLIITTGVFTRDAIKEAQRDGATPIDLIDGNELVNKLKELNLGVNVKRNISEEIEVIEDWFKDM